MKPPASLRAVAVFEASKGVLALVAGGGLLRFAHVHAQPIADGIAQHLHLNPASGHPRVFARFLLDVTDGELRLLALGAIAYAAFRFVEAWGLWRGLRWAEWFALATGALYLPVELYELIHTRHWAVAVVLAVNALIVGLLAWRLWQRKSNATSHESPAPPSARV